MIVLWLAAGLLGPQGAAAVATGGGALIRTYRARTLAKDLEKVLQAMRRPIQRAKRKNTFKAVEGEIRGLLARLDAAPKAAGIPLAIDDLRLALGVFPRVEQGTVSPADWRMLVIAAAQQAASELEARQLMEEEEEAVMSLLMAA